MHLFLNNTEIKLNVIKIEASSNPEDIGMQNISEDNAKDMFSLSASSTPSESAVTKLIGILLGNFDKIESLILFTSVKLKWFSYTCGQ